MRSKVLGLAMAGVALIAGVPASAATIWYTTTAGFNAAAPGAGDPTGMSGVTTNEEAFAIQEAAPSPWRRNESTSQDLILGPLQFNTLNSGFGGFAVTIDGFGVSSDYGIAGATYRIGNPSNENHRILIGDGGARAFGFSIYEPVALAQCGGVGCLPSRFTVVAYDLLGAQLGFQNVDFTTAGGTKFIGLTSDVAIGRIEVFETNLGPNVCCIYDNEYFGGYRMTAFATAVPEPGTWAMMIGGFGMVGGAMRGARGRRRMAAA